MPENLIWDKLDRIQIIVLMGTRLGIKGVGLDERVLTKIAAAKQAVSERQIGDRIRISADGGIRTETVPKLRNAGADIITPGSLVFKSQNLEETTSRIRGSLAPSLHLKVMEGASAKGNK